jgi:hypothetical protein
MQYHSLTEYFYKCYSMTMLIVLMPIFVQIMLYLGPSTDETTIAEEPVLFVLISIAIIACWSMLALYSNKKIKSLRNRQGLGEKLDKYFHLTIVRFLFLSIAGLIFAFGFFIAHNDVFTIGFVFNLLISAMLWPFPGTVCRQLKLKGDEREMVYHRRDVL